MQTYNTTTNMYGSSPSLISTDLSSTSSSSSHALQLVPYTNQQQQQQQGPKVLTNEQLNKLYNMQPSLVAQMPFQQPYHHHLSHHQHPISSHYMPAAAVPPLTISPASTMQYNYPPAPAYGFQMHIFPSQTPGAIAACNNPQMNVSLTPPSVGFNVMDKALIQTVPQQVLKFYEIF